MKLIFSDSKICRSIHKRVLKNSGIKHLQSISQNKKILQIQEEILFCWFCGYFFESFVNDFSQVHEMFIKDCSFLTWHSSLLLCYNLLLSVCQIKSFWISKNLVCFNTVPIAPFSQNIIPSFSSMADGT